MINRSLKPARVFETIHFGMMNDTVLLHALIVATTNDFPFKYEHRTDGDTAGRPTQFRLPNRRFQKNVHTAF